MIKPFLAAPLALVAYTSTAGPKFIDYDMGGSVLEYSQRIAEARRNGDDVRIRGKAYSAATMWLDVACIYPYAQLGFHGAYGGSDVILPLMESLKQSYWPVGVQEWYLIHAKALGPSEVAIMYGQQAIDLGARECED